MTADVVPLASERKPKVIAVVNREPVGLRSLEPRTLAVERCADQIARAMGRLTLEQRIVVDRALDALADEIAWHGRRNEPW
jgi:hypothetical protein